MKEVIIRFSNEFREILLVKKGRSTQILDSQRISSQEDARGFLQRNSCSIKKVTAILDDEHTVVKGVTTPVMKPKDIEGFVRTNSADYFALDQSEYSVDYRVMARDRKKNEMTMILAAARKTKLREIWSFLEGCSLKAAHIFIMQELQTNLAISANGRSAATVSISGSRASISIARGKSLFLQASFESEGNDGEDLSSITDNIMYYLNFYSKQNFGETVEMIGITGDKDSSDRISKALELSFDGKISISLKSGQEYEYLNGIQRENEAILGKQLDYAYPGTRCQSTPFCRTMLHRIAAMTILTILFQAGFLGVEKLLISRLEANTTEVSSAEVTAAKEALNGLKEKAALLESDISVIEGMESEDKDLLGKLYLIQKSIPSNIGIDRMAISNKGMDIMFRMKDSSGSTLDAARLVLAINDTDVFEPVQLSFLEMDDSMETFRLELKYREAKDGQ
jgi:hypothetical protein